MHQTWWSVLCESGTDLSSVDLVLVAPLFGCPLQEHFFFPSCPPSFTTPSSLQTCSLSSWDRRAASLPCINALQRCLPCLRALPLPQYDQASSLQYYKSFWDGEDPPFHSQMLSAFRFYLHRYQRSSTAPTVSVFLFWQWNEEPWIWSHPSACQTWNDSTVFFLLLRGIQNVFN